MGIIGGDPGVRSWVPVPVIPGFNTGGWDESISVLAKSILSFSVSEELGPLSVLFGFVISLGSKAGLQLPLGVLVSTSDPSGDVEDSLKLDKEESGLTASAEVLLSEIPTPIVLTTVESRLDQD